MSQLQRFRVIVRRGEHPTNSLTIRVYDILGVSAEEVRRLCPPPQGLSVRVLPCEVPMSPEVVDNLMARRWRRLARMEDRGMG